MMDELRELYQELILDHARAPRNFRTIPHAQHETLGANPLCGDRLTIGLNLDAQERISDIAFVGQGCAISMASASLMTEMVRGKSVAEAEELFRMLHLLCTETDDPPGLDHIDPDARDRLVALSGVRRYPLRVKCATLAWHALDAALHEQKQISTE